MTRRIKCWRELGHILFCHPLTSANCNSRDALWNAIIQRSANVDAGRVIVPVISVCNRLELFMTELLNKNHRKAILHLMCLVGKHIILYELQYLMCFIFDSIWKWQSGFSMNYWKKIEEENSLEATYWFIFYLPSVSTLWIIDIIRIFPFFICTNISTVSYHLLKLVI